MFQNLIKVAWRIIFRQKVYSVINILGLSLGICACTVIYLIAAYELSFDSFHPDRKRIYRVMGDVTEGTGEKLHFLRLPLPLTQAVRTELSGLDIIAGIVPYNAKIIIREPGKSIKHFESRLSGTQSVTTVIAEPQYFDIFRYDWLAGNPANALKDPFTVVLTEKKARQYFGLIPLQEIIGKEVLYDDSVNVTVSGIIKDWDKNTDLGFTDFISFNSLQSSYLTNSISTDSWDEHDMNTWTFAKLSKGTTATQVNARMEELIQKHAGPKIKLVPWLEPLSDIHFNGDVVENPVRTAHLPTLYSLMGIALFILILAIINFINLSTAQSIQRTKEIGVRKVLGSSRAGLTVQFLTETFFLTFFAILLAVLLVRPVLNAFQSFIPTGITFHIFNFPTLIFLAVITIMTTLFSGLYPASILSSYLPVTGLRGVGTHHRGEKWLLRKGLIIFQFTVSLVFIMGTIVIASQLRYTRQKDLGFSSNAIISVGTPWGDSLSKIAFLVDLVKKVPGVDKVALQWVPPMTGNGRGHAIKFSSNDVKETGVTQVAGNEDLIPLYQIRLLAGRNLLPADSMKEIIINENLSVLMGYKKPAEAIGKQLFWDGKAFPVVGVVADFHTRSFHDPITPLCIVHRPDRESTLAIKLVTTGKESAAVKTILSRIENRWKQVYPAGNFSYQFYDESLALLYEKDQQTATLMNLSMGITIFISCIGLFGLALFTSEKRSKEISIRKILGAGVTTIVTMLCKDFILLVIVAIFIATPIAWYFMNQWLQNFAYRITIGWDVFILAGTTAIGIALITVSFQAIKAAMANPVKNLRNG